MGLDIRGCSNIRFISEEYPEGLPFDEKLKLVSVFDEDFPEYVDGLRNGYYSCEEAYHFHGGSYSGWGCRRRQLCEWHYKIPPETVWENPELYKGQPFFEIIYFTDCDGTIGPITSAKLLNDFLGLRGQMEEDFKDEIDNGYGIHSLFSDMIRALTLASQNGCLRFA